MMKRALLIVVGALGVVMLSLAVWFFFFRADPNTEQEGNPTFNTGVSQTTVVTPASPTAGENDATPLTTPAEQSTVFRVVNEPVIGATVVQSILPTTTIARYVQQRNGHIFDLVLDSSGAVPKALSNTTIPGVTRVLWAGQGKTAILQYLDDNIVKTVSLGLPAPTATTTGAVSIKFFPDNIQDIAVAPNGNAVVYLLRNEKGVRGFIAAPDSTGSREVFTLPLKEVVISWPNQNTLLASTKSSAGVAGIAFSITISSGAVVPLLHAPGLTLIANPAYSYIVYQTTTGVGATTYARQTSTGRNTALSFSPYPERCVWGQVATSTLYCATPIEYVAPNYLEQWYAGLATAEEALISFSFPSSQSNILAIPGSEDGGTQSTIDSIAVSPDEKYLLFVRRGDRSLWGVRLP